jgi:3-phenylpropionate/trans-cinnamate dioxygenase ferredoxin component
VSTPGPGFVRVANLSELPDAGRLCLEVDERFVVLVRLGDEVFCLDDVCTHDGGTFGDGLLEDNCLVCPRHGAKFDVRTGEAVVMPATEPTVVHDVKIEGTEIFVKLRD